MICEISEKNSDIVKMNFKLKNKTVASLTIQIDYDMISNIGSAEVWGGIFLDCIEKYKSIAPIMDKVQ